MSSLDSRLISSLSLSPWVTLNERELINSKSHKSELYHSLSQSDYVTVLAITQDKQVILVKQYRPALIGYSVELPGGLADNGSEPILQTAERELYEESGFTLTQPLVHLGTFSPDTGRLENRLWGFFAENVHFDSNWVKEEYVDPFTMHITDFKSSICNGIFDNALHIALVGSALLRNLI